MVLLQYTSVTFDRILLYTGYNPFHSSDWDNINLAGKPLIFIGDQDTQFKDESLKIKNVFTNYKEVISLDAGHHLPYANDSKFADTISYLRGDNDPGKRPVITLLGDKEVKIARSQYTDAGAQANDPIEGDICLIVVTGLNTIDVNVEGTYTIRYNVTNNSGTQAVEVIRTVIVEKSLDNDVPVITLLGDKEVTINKGTQYTDAGAQASDPTEGDISSLIVVTGLNTIDVNGRYLYNKIQRNRWLRKPGSRSKSYCYCRKCTRY